MPRVRQYTPELRTEDARRRQADRNRDIIVAACKVSDYKSLAGLSRELGVSYSSLYQSLRLGSIRAVDMAKVIRLLELDADTVQALMGNPKRCRYEKGYVA